YHFFVLSHFRFICFNHFFKRLFSISELMAVRKHITLCFTIQTFAFNIFGFPLLNRFHELCYFFSQFIVLIFNDIYILASEFIIICTFCKSEFFYVYFLLFKCICCMCTMSILCLVPFILPVVVKRFCFTMQVGIF